MTWYTRGVLAYVAVAVGLCTAAVSHGAQAPVKANSKTISFGTRQAGSETTRVVTFTNTTEESVVFGFVSLFTSVDPNPGVFDISVTTCIPPSDPSLPPDEFTTLDPGETCRWEITFRPGATNRREVYKAVFDYIAVPVDEYAGFPGPIGHYEVRIRGAGR